jgi:hypothetical protein
MSDIASVRIPGEHVAAVTTTALGLYGAHASEVGASAAAFLDGDDELGELEDARRELGAIEDVLADLGWPRAPRGDPAELVGPRRVLREVVRSALLDAADAVVETLARYEAGREELPAVRCAVEAVPALFAAFAGFEDAAAAAAAGAGAA